MYYGVMEDMSYKRYVLQENVSYSKAYHAVRNVLYDYIYIMQLENVIYDDMLIMF